MVDLAAHIRAGDGVWLGQTSAEAMPLVDALLDVMDAIGPVRAFCRLSFNRKLREAAARWHTGRPLGHRVRHR
jgi:hypothetical protein